MLQYVRFLENGQYVYPYDISQIRKDFKNISFPAGIQNDFNRLSKVNIYQVIDNGFEQQQYNSRTHKVVISVSDVDQATKKCYTIYTIQQLDSSTQYTNQVEYANKIMQEELQAQQMRVFNLIKDGFTTSGIDYNMSLMQQDTIQFTKLLTILQAAFRHNRIQPDKLIPIKKMSLTQELVYQPAQKVIDILIQYGLYSYTIWEQHKQNVRIIKQKHFTNLNQINTKYGR